tara:strand:+ start:3880 stop:4182 length:303 start_codon:yes stop_codon:yes gene_type:complete
MTFDEYQVKAKQTAIYDHPVIYPTLGLCGESGEVAEKVKKHLRDGTSLDELKKELGDVLWYLASIASDLNISLNDIALTNVEKLQSRMERGKIQGSGDNR